MKNQAILAFVIIIFLAASLVADDLYRLELTNYNDAALLQKAEVEPLVRTGNTYLVLMAPEVANQIMGQLDNCTFIDKDISKIDLYIDGRKLVQPLEGTRTIYDENGLRLMLLDSRVDKSASEYIGLFPIRNESIKFEYKPPSYYYSQDFTANHDLESLVANIEQDSLTNFSLTLQTFGNRLAATTPCYNARDWMVGKFQSFGYTNVVTDQFYNATLGGAGYCYNIICTKTGTEYPDRVIVVGAHYDAVPGSPGADDNGSGTVAVLEIARALANIDTKMTIKFVLFDDEEAGLFGSWEYSSTAAFTNENIICMVNMDMIADHANTDQAHVYSGAERGYANLWADLSYLIGGIYGNYAGHVTNSDHYPFTQNGFNVVYSEEYIFSSVYHTFRDSTSRMSFDYLTRMAKVNLATLFTINEAPPPVVLSGVYDVGNGSQARIEWSGLDLGEYNSLKVFVTSNDPPSSDSITVPASQGYAVISGLITGTEYNLYAVGEDFDGDKSVLYNEYVFTPLRTPQPPVNPIARPEYRSIALNWSESEVISLDFDHYQIIRDGVLLPDIITDTFYVDADFSLGSTPHEYFVVSVDNENKISDTTGVQPVIARAASLAPGRILAVNRSSVISTNIVDESKTTEFLNQALTGYDYDYYSDTAHAAIGETDTLKLDDFLDYELVVFGCESARLDDLGRPVVYGGILDSVGAYLQMGGKVIVFGRWGDVYTGGSNTIQVNYDNPDESDFGWNKFFHVNSRILPLTLFTMTTLSSDLVGADPIVAGYPTLTWDSIAAVEHSVPWTDVSGIPCPSYLIPRSSSPEVIYTYKARNSGAPNNGQTIAWRYLGEDYSYVLMDLPLSFMERSGAIAALQQAVSDMSLSASPGRSAIDPDTIDIENALPATVDIYLGNFMPGKTAADVDVTSLSINETVSPLSTNIIASYPDFSGEVLQVTVTGSDFADSYGGVAGTTGSAYIVNWQFTGEGQQRLTGGPVTLIGPIYVPPAYIVGDANGDGSVNIVDASFIVNYIFFGGEIPDPLESGDANCDGSCNVVDASFIINYIFFGGPEPVCE